MRHHIDNLKRELYAALLNLNHGAFTDNDRDIFVMLAQSEAVQSVLEPHFQRIEP